MKLIDRRWHKACPRIGLLLVSALALSGMSGAETLDEIINPKQVRNEWVSDMAGVIDPETRRRLNAVVDHLEQITTAEIAVVTIRRTDRSTPKVLPRHCLSTALWARKARTMGCWCC